MKVLAPFLQVALPAILSAQSVVSGVVYRDANGNERRDPNEAGIADVAVSNGREVVATDAQGRYELPVGDDTIIFVIKPAGYAVPLDDHNQPRYYYIHKPGGSPQLKYGGVAATGPLPVSVDFPLVPREEAADFTALVVGDPQPLNERELEYFARGVVAELEGVKGISFGLSLGDLVWNRLDLFKPYRQVIGRVGVPWYNVMGNHDMDHDAKTDEVSDETYEANFGPANYAFNVGQAHFIVLDDVLYPDPRGGEGIWGGFRPDQLEFVANDLKRVARDKLVVVSFHVPLLHKNEAQFRNADRQRLFDLLKDYPNVLILSAHTHVQRQNFYGKEDGWQGAKSLHEYNAGTACGDWHSGELDARGLPPSTMRDGTPKGYAFLRVTGNQYVIDYQVAGAPPAKQISIFNPKVVARGRRTLAGIYANFFMGYKNSLVEYRINESRWRPMAFVEEFDPGFAALVTRWDVSDKLLAGRRPSNPFASTHLWRANIPFDLPVGEHRIEVRATDMFGRTFQEKSSYRLEEPVFLPVSHGY